MPGFKPFLSKPVDDVVAKQIIYEERLLDDELNTLELNLKYQKEVEKHPDEVTEYALSGLKKAEAALLVWPKKAMYLTYAWLWVCFFMLAFQLSINSQVIYFAYAKFEAAPEISTASILSSIIGGVVLLPIGRILNLWGRCEGFAICIVVYLIGIIVISTCNNADSYAAGYVLYTIGYNSINMILTVFIADTSGLRNRAFAFGYIATPTIATAYVGPLAAQSFLNNSSWRWAIGAFGFIMPVVFLPVGFVFKFYERKAVELGVLKWERSGRTWKQSVVHYVHEFDVIGAFLLIAAFVLLLLPFSLQANGKAEFKSATFIVMVIVGALLLPVFGLWEKYGARTHFIPWVLLKQPTVLGACILSLLIFLTFYCWDLYFYNFSIVVYDMTIANVGYLVLTYTVTQCFWSFIFGIWVRYWKTFKYSCLFFGVPLQILGTGLMIHFRGQESNIGYIVMCQIFMAVAGGTLIIGADMAAMASADIDGVPMMLALLSIFASVGGAIGYAAAAAIYGNTFPSKLLAALPDEYKDQYLTIYAGGYITQMSYPVGSEVRNAINYAWGRSQRMECIVATAIMVLGFPAVGIWRNYRVDKKQNKGTVL